MRVYKFESDSWWIEVSEIDGNTEQYNYRSGSDDGTTASWKIVPFFVGESFQTILSYYRNLVGWTEVTPDGGYGLGFSVYDAPKEAPEPIKHKCTCTMATLWREGCKCQGI